jgi:hypothetical protein
MEDRCAHDLYCTMKGTNAKGCAHHLRAIAELLTVEYFFAPNGGEFMHRTPQIQVLSGELDLVEDGLRFFSNARLAGDTASLTPEECLLYELLMRRRTEMIAQLVKLEREAA